MKILKQVFDITTNNNICAKVWTDDKSLLDSPHTLYQEDDIIYLLLSKTVGDEIEIKMNGKWPNLVISEQLKVSKSKLLINIKETLKYIKNDSRTEISGEEALSYFEQETGQMFNVLDKVFDIASKNDSQFAKRIFEQLGKKQEEQDFDPMSVITNIAKSLYFSFSKQFKILIPEKEVKSAPKTKAGKKKEE